MICADGILYLAFQNMRGNPKAPYSLISQHDGSDAHIVHAVRDNTGYGVGSWAPSFANIAAPMFPGHKCGGPAFINFGRNNANARDGYVYAVSSDQRDNGSNRRLGRVPKADILRREAGEWVCAFALSAEPAWSHDPNEEVEHGVARYGFAAGAEGGTERRARAARRCASGGIRVASAPVRRFARAHGIFAALANSGECGFNGRVKAKHRTVRPKPQRKTPEPPTPAASDAPAAPKAAPPAPKARRNVVDGPVVPASMVPPEILQEANGNGGSAARPAAVLPVLPLGDLVLFPSMIAPLIVNTQRSMRLAQEVARGDRLFIAVLQRKGEMPDDQVGAADLHEVGCLARLIKLLKFPDDTLRILVQGEARCQIVRCAEQDGFLRAAYIGLKDSATKDIELEALARSVSQRFQEVITLSPTLPEELKIALFNTDDPSKLADLVASNLNLPLPERQALLEELDVRARLQKIIAALHRERELLRLSNEIQTKVSETFTKGQREYFLREQLKTIQRELGEVEQPRSEVEEIRKKIEAAGLPAEARKAADKELERLAVVPPMSPEYGVIRTYLDWLAEMPWAKTTEDRLDIAHARGVLDRDHYDLARVKDRILEFLAVLKLKQNLKGPILCFAGPPGVGKTSLGRSIAAALGREFVRLSLGGVRDEAEIRGHRRTYIGALPGRIVQGLRRAGSRNPVFMLDEVDKLGADFRGDPAAALLEVLDPEQNFAFSDHYLDVPFDLSRVLFITTANTLDGIPPALRDRMEVLDLPGYTPREKLHIARRHLVPKQLAAHGLTPGQLRLPAATIEAVIAGYTREAGVRNLEREIANVCRKTARAVAEGRRPPAAVPPERLRALLGPKRFESETAETAAEPGIAVGLAWTPTGGDILFIEVARMPGKGNVILTGSLGDVMKESAQAAVSYVRARAARYGLPENFIEKTDLHIHVPAGAIPKDGPSAGLALAAALVSLVTGRALPADLAMTGEITLRGRVMPVGGVKEKVLAAARAGIRRIVLPARNRDALAEVPADIRRVLKFRFVKSIDAALDAALNGRPARRAARAGRARGPSASHRDET